MPEQQKNAKLILVATILAALVSIWSWAQAIAPHDLMIIGLLLFAIPLVVLIAFIGYSTARRTITWRMLIVFTVAEMVAIGITYALRHHSKQLFGG